MIHGSVSMHLTSTQYHIDFSKFRLTAETGPRAAITNDNTHTLRIRFGLPGVPGGVNHWCRMPISCQILLKYMYIQSMGNYIK